MLKSFLVLELLMLENGGLVLIRLEPGSSKLNISELFSKLSVPKLAKPLKVEL